MRNVSISTVLILVLAGLAAVAYYVGTPPPQPSASQTSDSCSPMSVEVTIPQGVGTSTAATFEPPTLTVVVGVNSTVVWNDQDTTAPHDLFSVSVPPSGGNWYFSGMTAGNTYCVTLTVPGTYTYNLILSYVVVGIIIVKQ